MINRKSTVNTRRSGRDAGPWTNPAIAPTGEGHGASETDENSQMQFWAPALTMAFPIGGAYDDAFPEGEEPLWFTMILDDGYELQRSGIDMTTVAIDTEILKKEDRRYEVMAGPGHRV